MSRRRLSVILAHEWRLARRDPLPAMVLVLFPIITMAFLKPAFRAALQQGGFPHANGAEQVVPGQAVVSAFFIVSLDDVRVLLRVRMDDVGSPALRAPRLRSRS